MLLFFFEYISKVSDGFLPSSLLKSQFYTNNEKVNNLEVKIYVEFIKTSTSIWCQVMMKNAMYC